jgi:hypothetical protein
MDALDAAVVDVALLIATCRALRLADSSGSPAEHGVLRTPKRLRRQVAAATAGYLRNLARVADGAFDTAQLRACRAAAETRMPDAVAQQLSLAVLLRERDDALGNSATVRHDLWRLAHLATRLRRLLRESESEFDARHARRLRKPGKRLQRRVRQAMIAYARTAMQVHETTGASVRAARLGAMAKLGTRSARDAETLVALRADATGGSSAIELAVARPLLHLAQDWLGD